MQIRVCDRCGVPVPEVTARETVRGVTVPADSPASAPVTAPVDVNLSIVAQTPADLCALCRLSAMVEYIALEIRATQAADVIKILGARLVKILKGGA